jgi:PKD repeat protein
MRSRKVLLPISLLVLILMLTSLVLAPVPAMAVTETDMAKVDPALVQRLETEGEAEFYVILVAQADLSGAAALETKPEKTAYVFEQLKAVADWTQRPLLAYLEGQGVTYQSMYIENMIRVEAGLQVVQALAARPEVDRIVSPPDARPDPTFVSMTPAERVATVEWNVARIHAPEAWGMGYDGDGMVVASNDTGVEYTHPALVGKYRGNLGGGNFDHNYNWWDGPGGYQYPHDYDEHGTHTTGTMVGDDDAGNQIGVAPGAQWIACGGLGGTDPLDCFQFFLTPWDLNGQNPDPAKAPDAINNSWYDPSGFDYRPIIQALNAAGIAVIKSAGNQGAACSTITNPGYVPEIITTGAFAQGDIIAGFSSRGPTSNYGQTILKPEVAAPGVNIRSSVPGGGYEGGWQGTSMAAPHSTALVALIWNAAPCLRGDVPATKQIMMETAEPMIDAQCPPFVDHPNNVWGWGILDAEAAVQAASDYCGCEAPDIDYVWSNSPVELGEPMQFEVQLTAGTEPLSYSWNMDGPGNGVGLDTPTPVFTYTSPGIYTPTVTVVNVCGSAEAALTVEVTCEPPAVIGLVSDSPVELGQPMHLEVQVTGSEPFTYTWDMAGPGESSGLDTATPVFTYTEPGIYTPTVTVENACGSDSGELAVEVICDPPVATFASNSPVTIGEPIAFTALVSGTEPLTYTWSFGGPGRGTGLDTPTPVFTYTAYGSFTAVLTVTNPCGMDIFSDAVQVLPQTIYLPILFKGAGG